MSPSYRKVTVRARRRDPRGPFVASCPTREVLDQLADKWSVLVLIALSRQPVRFNALKRTIEGISQKVLTSTLRTLERNGLVARVAFATVPVTVEYSATPLGRSLYAPLEAIRRWSIEHIDDVARARRGFDRDRARDSKARSGVQRPAARPIVPT